MPLKAAASKLDPSSQSPQIPALPCESNMHGIPGVFVGRAAPLRNKYIKLTIKFTVIKTSYVVPCSKMHEKIKKQRNMKGEKITVLTESPFSYNGKLWHST